MSHNFDEFAKLYDMSLTPLPDEYIQLIQKRFGLGEHDKILDLGCGSGLLTLPISRFSSGVQGLDSSRRLLKIARDRDLQKRVCWIHNYVEKFDFGRDNYKLIISFEAFHLFPNQKELIKKCSLALKAGGYICVGWVEYQWELILKNKIIDIFALYGIPWGEWGYQDCSKFTDLVKESKVELSSVVVETTKVKAISHIKDIAVYLSCIDKASLLKLEERQHLAHELEASFEDTTPSKWIEGFSQYAIAYCIKLAD